MKKVLVILGLCLLIGYFIFAAFFFGDKPQEEICNQFEIVTIDDSLRNFVELAELEKEVDEKGLNPYGKQLKDINLYAISQTISDNPMVKSAKVFITNKGGIRAEVLPRQPILRVMLDDGTSYYIDSDTQKMPLSKKIIMYLPVVTGIISEDYPVQELCDFAQYLKNNDFWNAQIEQIHILPNKDVELVPRVGNHKISFGSLEHFEDKLNRLFTFYHKGLQDIGWNRYSVINLKYDKQIVCTKR
ncbi:cell division protein FtsQ/DivIB [Dysgonomonas sp. 520]|uniref:cell division protein FtsQ/DivIB n=1 Tax=Dysgonomonas sp. 520 TaxID=2302931 RepID=UPI0013D5AC11|nr:cell division protein FtsQ/DivIB [Dysgonomonas sp. 520]NDW10867.1 hypothetical protein [Dysgonomonas sp. 520]